MLHLKSPKTALDSKSIPLQILFIANDTNRLLTLVWATYAYKQVGRQLSAKLQKTEKQNNFSIWKELKLKNTIQLVVG